MKAEMGQPSESPVIHVRVWLCTPGITHSHGFSSESDSRTNTSGGDYKTSGDWIIFRVLRLILGNDVAVQSFWKWPPAIPTTDHHQLGLPPKLRWHRGYKG